MQSITVPESKGLSSILGQEVVVRLLRHALVSKRLHHAYLFEGIDGIGKSTCAKALFAALNCEIPPLPGDACGTCSSCRKIHSGTHPDLILVNMTLGGLAEEIGQLLRRLSYPAHEGKATLVLFDPADQFSAPTALVAANRLLKALEEPIANTYFVFVTQNAQNLLPTMRSRMQRLRFTPLPDATVREQLMLRHVLAQELLDSVVTLAQGSLGQALQNMNQKEQCQTRIQRAKELLAAAQTGYASDIVKICSSPDLTDREEAQFVLHFMMLDLYKKLYHQEIKSPFLIQQIRWVQETMVALKRFISPSLALERMLRNLHPALSAANKHG